MPLDYTETLTDRGLGEQGVGGAVEVELDASPGQLTGRATVESPASQAPDNFIESAFKAVDVGDDLNIPTVTFSMEPASWTELNAIRDTIVSELTGELGIPRTVVSQIGFQDATSEITGAIPGIESVSFNVPVGERSSRTLEASFPTIKIPRIGPIDEDFIEDAYSDVSREPVMTLRVAPGNPVNRLVTGDVQTQVALPADTFIELVDPTTTNCSDLYPDIAEDVNDVTGVNPAAGTSPGPAARRDIRRGAFPEGGGGVLADVETVNSIHSTLTSAVSGDLRDATLEDITSIRPDRIRDFRDQIGEVDLTTSISIPGEGEVSPERALEIARSTRSDVVDEVGLQKCRTNFTGRLDTTIDRGEEIINQLDEARENLSAVRSLLSRGDLPCSSRHPGLESDISTFEQRVDSISEENTSLTDVAGLIRDGENLIQQVQRNDTVDGDCAERFIGRVESSISELRTIQNRIENLTDQIPCSEEFSSIASDVDSFTSDVENLSVSDADIRTIRSELQRGRDLTDRIRRNVDRPNCASQFTSDIQTAIEELLNIQGRLDTDAAEGRIDSLTSQIQDLIEALTGGADRGVPGGTTRRDVLDCGDVPSWVRSEVSGFEQNVSVFRRRDRGNRTEDRRGTLLDESETVLSDIQNEVSDRNPCKSRLRSRVRESRSDLESAQIGREGPTPCFEQYPDIESGIDSLESAVVGSNRISVDQANSIIDQATTLADRVSNEIPEDSRCRRNFSERIQSVISRTRSITSRMDVEAQVDTPASQNSQRIEELSARLEEIVQQSS